MLANFVNILLESKFFKDFSIMISGTVLAQAISVLTLPIIARLYLPEDFGNYVYFNSIIFFAGVLVGLKFELAIVLPEKEETVYGIVKIGILASIFISAIYLLIFSALFLIFHKFSLLHVFLIPLNTLIIGITSYIQMYFMRLKKYREQSIIAIFQSILFSSYCIGFFFIYPKIGMFLGFTLSQFSTLILFIYAAKTPFFTSVYKVKFQELKKIFREYIDIPKFLLWSEFLAIFNQQAPILLLGSMFDKSIVGAFSLVYRMLRLPSMIVGNAIGNILRNEAIALYKAQGNFADYCKSLIKKLTIFSLVAFTLIGLSVKWLFNLFLGPTWFYAGELAVQMTPMFIFEFIMCPLLSVYIVTEAHKLSFKVKLISSIAVVTSMYSGYLITKSPDITIAMFELVLIILSITNIVIAYSLAKGNKQNSIWAHLMNIKFLSY